MAAKKRKNSRAKGARGERLLRDEFKKAGFTARRNQQYSGLGPSDVIVNELPWLHIESKFTQKKAFLNWMEQAETEAKAGQVPMVCHKRIGRNWYAILPLADFLNILKTKFAQSHGAKNGDRIGARKIVLALAQKVP